MLWLVIIFGLTYLALQAWILRGWLCIPEKQIKPSDLPLSVIIAAHNEVENLKKFLPHVLRQNYRDYEVVLVLDRSNDGSKEWLAELNNSRLSSVIISETPEGWAPKKWALTQGIEAAKNEHLVFTDADCQPQENWLSEVAGHFTGNTELVLGIGPYFQYPGLLNAFIQFETAYAAFQYVGLAVNGFPYMGVGRNIAYTRSFFQRNGGFRKFKDKLSGDDDLLVNAFARKENTTVMVSEKSKVFSEPKHTFYTWFRQKLRHISASTDYSSPTKIILGIFHLSHLGFYLFGLLLCMTNLTGWAFFSLYILKMGISGVMFAQVAVKIGMRRIIWAYPVLDFLFFIYNLSAVPIGLIRKPSWI
ncbi:MAG: glycosyltransferase [Bacteroidia bacterium]|nr:glycosyltransferase [Bacteroidia bacterium]